MRRILFPIVAVLCLALAAQAMAADPEPPKKPVGKDVGLYLKEFSLKAPLDGGKTFTNQSFYGKPTIYSFVQSACSICRNEIREMNALYPELKGKMNFVAVFLDVDDSRMAKYKEKNGIEFLMLHDPGADVLESIGYSSSPAILIVSADGQILKKLTGYQEKMVAEAVKDVK